MKTNRRVVLIGFYQEKALGVRYLANAVERRGYEPHIVLFKCFQSRNPAPATQRELQLLGQLLEELDPYFTGLSVMSSLYLETVNQVAPQVQRHTRGAVGWGGVFATLVPQAAAGQCDMVLRGEGERTLPDLLDRLESGAEWRDLPGVAYWDPEGRLVENPLPPLEQDLDQLGAPAIGRGAYYVIEGDRCRRGDPQLGAFTYELSASRGCPFQCSYCSSVCLRRLYPGQRYIRFRSVDSVMDELNEAKRRLPRLRVVHFWDEIFSDEPGWVEAFARRYKEEIGLPFRIWGHPLKVHERVIRHLVDAGLNQIVVGIQSGSPRVRREVFHRNESQEQIRNAAQILHQCRVPRIVYDLMLCHPFERPEDRAQTLELCRTLPGRFHLEIHGLNFLPATDIVGMALQAGYYTPEEMESMLYAPLAKQYGEYWGPANQVWRQDPWVALIYLSQFPGLKSRVDELEQTLRSGGNTAPIFALRARMERRERWSDLRRKALLFLRH